MTLVSTALKKHGSEKLKNHDFSWKWKVCNVAPTGMFRDCLCAVSTPRVLLIARIKNYHEIGDTAQIRWPSWDKTAKILKIRDFHQKSMKTNENQWKSMKIMILMRFWWFRCSSILLTRMLSILRWPACCVTHHRKSFPRVISLEVMN